MKKISLKYESKDNASFQQFMLSEYDNIAQAHFNTVNNISNFFRYYLLIITIPIPLIALSFQNMDTSFLSKIKDSIQLFICYGTLTISLIGFCVLIYIINLRFDVLLYARTVNGIRKYFYNLSDLNTSHELKIRILPTVVSAPTYLEWRFFYSVVLALSVANSLYLTAFLFNLFLLNNSWSYNPFNTNVNSIIPFIVITASSISVSTLAYYILGRHREKEYLTQPIIGIDIDGVLNKHREHFCCLLKKNCNKEINPDDITKIPVHKCDTLKTNVDKADGYAIFNDPDYWTEMPVADGCINTIQKLKNEHNYKIEIFTYRPWPEEKTFPSDKKEKYILKWQAITHSWRRNGLAIRKATKKWLNKNDIPFDKITIENGSVYTPNPKSFTKNRYQRARKKNIHIFVEDQISNAVRLAQFCNVVFLIDHPYNRDDDENISKNIIRVQNWEQLYLFIKDKL